MLDEFGALPAPSARLLPAASRAAAPISFSAAAAAIPARGTAAAEEARSPATSLPLSTAQLGSTLSVTPVREPRSLVRVRGS